MTTPEPGSEPTPDRPTAEQPFADRVFRSPLGIASGVFLVLLAAGFAGDAMIRGKDNAPWVALAGFVLAVPLIVAFTIRPAVYVNNQRLRIRNPFRSITLPWGTVADVRAGYSSEVFTQDGAKYQLWAIPVSLRQRKKAARKAARASQDDPHGRTSTTADVRDTGSRTAPADQTIADLRELAERHGRDPEAQGEPQVRWAYEILAPAAAGLLLLVILIAIG
ncbi:PH domain-containing protein [Streptomyces sp. NPDC020807]|uniref:PH domain-containing protein n=1 Tax=Streptomyces sp. NPDC020807 TaxID=3155119 RepID=UPI0033FC311E